jgi:hypothetical protein
MTMDPSPNRLLERVLAVAHLLTLPAPAEAPSNPAKGDAPVKQPEKPAEADLCYSKTNEQTDTT